MNPWIIITLAMAGIIWIIDYILRKKKWKDNSKQEKISLLINMFSAGPYAFLSALGMLLGIVAYSPETSLGIMLYDITLKMAGVYFVVAASAVISSLVLRKKGKTKASILVNVYSILYITAVLFVNSIAGKIF